MNAISSVKLEDWLKIAAMVGGLVAFAVAIAQYRSAELWKRVQFVGEAVRAMKSDGAFVNICIMLDSASRDVRLFPERPSVDEQFVRVTQQSLAQALRPYSDAHPFSEAESRIRDTVDGFLDHLEQFQQFVKKELVKIDSFRPLLAYVIDLIAHPSPAMKVNGESALWHYINEYGFLEAREFLVQLGVPVPAARRALVEYVENDG